MHVFPFCSECQIENGLCFGVVFTPWEHKLCLTNVFTPIVHRSRVIRSYKYWAKQEGLELYIGQITEVCDNIHWMSKTMLCYTLGVTKYTMGV